MKILLLLLSSCFLFSCQDSKSENKVSSTSAGSEKPEEDREEYAELIPQPLIDNKGQVMANMTLPASWKIHNEPGKAALSGPNGIFVFNLPLKSYFFSNDPLAQEIYSKSGASMRAFTTAREIINQDILPTAQKEGSKLIRITDVPEIAAADQSVTTMMYTIGSRDYRYEAVVSEWEDKDGKPYAIVVHVNGSGMGNTISWMYSGQILDSPAAEYELAKNTLVKGLATLQYNPRYFDQYNQNEMNRESQSWAAHNQRMSSQQRNFDAQQQAYRTKTDAINSSIMSSYNDRMAASDRSHNRFLNYIKDESTVANPADGQQYQVQGGAKQYWMNENGEYIGSDEPNYDPNRNQSTVNHTWTETEITE